MSFNECRSVLEKIMFNNNLKDNFFEYVYHKISQDTRNRFVERNDDSIDIILSNHPSIKVIPYFKNMDKDSLLIDKEMKIAVNIIKDTEYKYVYFVYPKNDNFNKHIQIKIPELENACSEYMIKLIPYSLNRLKKEEKCNGNGNILCK